MSPVVRAAFESGNAGSRRSRVPIRCNGGGGPQGGPSALDAVGGEVPLSKDAARLEVRRAHADLRSAGEISRMSDDALFNRSGVARVCRRS